MNCATPKRCQQGVGFRRWAVRCRVGRHLALTAVALAVSGFGVRPSFGLPYAATLNDICPGIPDPCVVNAKFLVANGTTFDLGGRALQLNSGAALSGTLGAQWTIQNASAITLQKGAYLASNGFDQDAGKVTILNGGVCTLDGKTQTNGYKNLEGLGGGGGIISIECDSISLGAFSTVEANGALNAGGSILLYAGSGVISAVKGAKVQAIGDGGLNGGEVQLVSDAPPGCVLPVVIETYGRRYVDPVTGDRADGPGGMIDITCVGDLLLDKGAKLTASSFRGAIQGYISIVADAVTVEEQVQIVNDGVFGAGTVSIEASTGPVTLKKMSTLGGRGQGAVPGQIQITSAGPCTLDGNIAANGYADRMLGAGGGGGGILVSCEGLTLGAQRAHLTADGYAFADYVNGEFNGGDGGEIELNGGGGPFIMEKGATVTASGSFGGAGSINIAGASCSIAGTVAGTSGPVASQTTGGGQVQVECFEDVSILGSAKLSAGARFAYDAQGGNVSIKAGDDDGATVPNADLIVEEGAKIVNDGVDALIGASADGDCSVSGTLSSKSKFGVSGMITVICSGGLAIGQKGLLSSEASGSFAGNVDVAAESCQVDGKLLANGSTVNDPENGPYPGGGGQISLWCNAGLTVNSTIASITRIAARGVGSESPGGGVLVEVPSGAAALGGKIDASGALSGGGISAWARDGVGASADLVATGVEDLGGYIDLAGGSPYIPGLPTGSVTVSKTLNVSGRDFGAGQIVLGGCNVTVDAAGVLKADAKSGGGTNIIEAHNVLTINGLLSAAGGSLGPNGMNELHYGVGYAIALPVISHVKPVFSLVYDLTPCP
jgi:hypothetical protein